MNERRPISNLLTLTVILLLCKSVDGAIVIDGFTSAKHDRFANDPSFIGSGLDFSGVGRSGTSGRWVTLISPDTFLTANHFAPSTGESVTFVSGNDPSGGGGTVTTTVSGGTRLGTTDLFIGTLGSAVTGVATYSIAPFLAGADAVVGGYFGQAAYLLGISPTGTLGTGSLAGNPTTSMSVGRNILDVAFGDLEVQAVSSTFDLAGYIDDTAAGDLTGNSMASANLIPDEAYLQGGDSGAPTFIVNGNGDLELLGIHSVIGELDFDNDDDTDRRFSGDNFLPRYAGQIYAIAMIPEPGFGGIIGVMLMALGILRRRREKSD